MDKEKHPHYKPSSEVDYVPKPEEFEPDLNFPPDHRFRGSRRCLAWSGRNGRQCMRLAMDGSTKCYVHGGNVPTGALAPQFKHGRYSKYLPQNLLAKYHDMQDDPELLSLRNEIEIIGLRIAELLETLGGYGDSTSWIRNLQRSYQKFQTGLRAGDTQKQNQAYREIGELIDHGAEKRDIWNELTNLFEARKRLANAERERIESMEAMWTAEQAMTFVTALSSSFRNVLEKHIDDSELRDLILKDQSLTIRGLVDKHGEMQQ